MNFYPDPYMMEETMMMVLPVLTSAIPSSLLAIASYVLTAMALHTLANRRGIQKAWLSWVPVLNVWILGSLSDQYRYVVKGQCKSKRKTLLVLNLLNLLLSAVLIGFCIFTVVDLVGGAIYGVPEQELMRRVMATVLSVLGLCLPICGLAIASAVIHYMALYDVYMSMDPGNSILFLVLSILFHVTEPFFLFFNRNRDGGMPPRKQEPQWMPQQPSSGTRHTEEKDYI